MSSTYQQNCQNLINNFSKLNMDNSSRESTDPLDANESLSPSNASPPDFDFNIPCRFFKSSFARSLSLTNASGSGNNNNHCKSLDYEMRSNNNNKLSSLKRDVTAVAAVPPLPQKRLSQAGSFYTQNEVTTSTANSNNNNNNNNNNIINYNTEYKQVYGDNHEEDKPPALPARRPLSLHNLTLTQNLSVNECHTNADQQQLKQKQQQHQHQQMVLTQLKQQAYKQATNNNNSNQNSLMSVKGNKILQQQQQQQQQQKTDINVQQKPQTSHNFSNNNNNNNNCNSSCVNNKNNILRRNNNNNNNIQIVWPHQQKNMEQDCNVCNFDQADEDVDGEDFHSNYHDLTKSSTVSDFNKHFHGSQQMIPTINIYHNQQQQQQQQQSQHHQMSSYEMLNDNTTNVEAVILQNQVDTLQWQLKQVETSCDMYRAVMEEVARFLERYQSQKQLQQQQQKQQQQQMANQKHNSGNNNNSSSNKVEQIPRSKSLFQVYAAGSHEKSSNGNINLDDTSTSLSSSSSSSTSYLRARSSTNLIDLKQQQSKGNCKSKDDNFETALQPSQSYSAFKDFTWRRSPKKTDSRLNIAKDDVEEKLNQEAFRLLRTIQNLLNTSQHQPDLAHQRHSLAPATALQMGRLSKAISTTSVMTLPGPPMLNSTSLTIGANSAGSSTPDSSTASPTISNANNTASNNLAPEMLFLRSANMRDSRLSLRSSTDSSVHSTSSAASSASSKVETDEEVSTPFHSPPNVLSHKQQQHHLAGSSTEDESGFSSISSFPDIGVPLSSTMLSSTPSSSKGRLMAKELKTLKTDLQTADSRNSTLKANVVGLPLNSPQDMSHRWDSPSKTYHNASNKFQRFSALTNEDSNTVLWV